MRPSGFLLHCLIPFIRTLIMLNQKFLDDISAKLNDALANSPVKDFEKNARALLAQGFSKLDLVTREEFDVQAEVLARARQKLDELEARIAALEAQQKS
jgi:BMFP domain-containing protein YqiC